MRENKSLFKSMKKNRIAIFALSGAVFLLSASPVIADVSQNASFKLYNGVANPIVNITTSGNFKVNSSGVPAAGSSNNVNFTLGAGSTLTFTPTLGAGGGSLSGGGGSIPDRVSIGSSLNLLGNESGILVWVMEDSRLLQIDVSKGSFPVNTVVYVKEEKLADYDAPLSSSPAVPLGSTAFRVFATSGSNNAPVTSSLPFVAKISQPSGRPLPADSKVYYFDDNNKIWVQITNTRQEGNGLVFVAVAGVKYAAFAQAGNQILISTQPNTQLDANKDGKIDDTDKAILVPIFKNLDIALSDKATSFPLQTILTDKDTLLKYLGPDSGLKQPDREMTSGGASPTSEEITQYIEENVQQQPFEEGQQFVPSEKPPGSDAPDFIEEEPRELETAGTSLLKVLAAAAAVVFLTAIIAFKFLGKKHKKRE